MGEHCSRKVGNGYSFMAHQNRCGHTLAESIKGVYKRAGNIKKQLPLVNTFNLCFQNMFPRDNGPLNQIRKIW